MTKLPLRDTLLFLALLGFSSTLRADVVPAPLFTDNAVLQRDKPVPVWGKAAPGEKVSVSFAGQTVAATADSSGKWRVDLAPLPVNTTPADLVIKGSNSITLTNILVGEVWLASGQSNMEWIVKSTYDASLDIPASANYPLIRHIEIKNVVSDTPSETVAIEKGKWQVAGPDTTGSFTAVGYYFAKDIEQLLNVPVGIINSSWGGTQIEPWINAETLAGNPAFAPVSQRWAESVAAYPERLKKYTADLAAWEAERDAAKAAGTDFTKRAPSKPAPPSESPQKPSALYNAMIHPLVPYALRGALWYQGESNAGRHSEYHALFSAMITNWRAQFAQGDFPFYWVQLSNFQNPDAREWAFLREAQTKTLSLPATGQAVSIDVGDIKDIHPRNKQAVGRRLARLALARTYGVSIPDSGPVFDKATLEGAGFRVSFTQIQAGLRTPFSVLGGFELAGEDRVFHPANAVIEKDTVLVTCAAVPAPVAVRYAWRNATEAGLFNSEGLPAVPFRSDTW